jgi:hypothetical protein
MLTAIQSVTIPHLELIAKSTKKVKGSSLPWPDDTPLDLGKHTNDKELIIAGETLIGLGIFLQLIFWGATEMSSPVAYVGLIFTVIPLCVYIWAIVAYQDYVEENSVKNAYRAWKINLTSFWVAISFTIINITIGAVHAVVSPILGIGTSISSSSTKSNS